MVGLQKHDKLLLPSKVYSEVFLISFAIFCQAFGYLDFSTVKNSILRIELDSTATIINAFLSFWFICRFSGKLVGAYLFGKIASSFRFYTAMRLVAIFYFLVAILTLTIGLSERDFFQIYKCFYFTRFVASSLSCATIFLSAVYLLNRYPISRHPQISTYVILAFFLSRFSAHALAHYIPYSGTKVFYILPVLISCIPFFIYSYLEKRTPKDVGKEKYPHLSSVSLKYKSICALLGIAWNLGYLYYCDFLIPYVKDISIIENGGLFFGNSLFFTVEILFLLPAAYICQKFGATKVLIYALPSILILGLFIPFLVFSKSIFYLVEVLFAVLSTCLLAPIVTIFFKLYKSSRNIFQTFFWFNLGSSISKLLLVFSCNFSFSVKFPFAGMLIFSVYILICLIAIFRLKFAKQRYKC